MVAPLLKILLALTLILSLRERSGDTRVLVISALEKNVSTEHFCDTLI
jgi:hypothetical protein